MKKIGICFGGYCPLHQGHMDIIMQAKKENDICYVIVCGYDNEPRGWEINLNLRERYTLIADFFKKDEQIIVYTINDTELGLDESMSDMNWFRWQNQVRHYLRNDKLTAKGNEFTWYVAEPFYKKCIENNNVLNAKVVLVDKTNPVSGTQIRSNPIKYWNKITAPFKPYLCKNILVIGTASEGKSTLVRDISRYFDIPYTEEYGRSYMEKTGMRDTDLTVNEFSDFLVSQNYNCILDRKISKNGLFICDTDNTVTLMYAKAYVDDKDIKLSKDDYDTLHRLAVKLHNESKYKWDHIFIVPPSNNFVDDGVRYMKQASIEERTKNFEILQKLVNEFYPETSKTYLTGSYLDNFNVVKNYINSLINN
jgi:NadR type nicotinamide-nucleotide adenylyltransferase